jgi:hypothetical protein
MSTITIERIRKAICSNSLLIEGTEVFTALQNIDELFGICEGEITRLLYVQIGLLFYIRDITKATVAELLKLNALNFYAFRFTYENGVLVGDAGPLQAGELDLASFFLKTTSV